MPSLGVSYREENTVSARKLIVPVEHDKSFIENQTRQYVLRRRNIPLPAPELSSAPPVLQAQSFQPDRAFR